MIAELNIWLTKQVDESNKHMAICQAHMICRDGQEHLCSVDQDGMRASEETIPADRNLDDHAMIILICV